MGMTGIAKLYKNRKHTDQSISEWLGILNLGTKHYLTTATVDVSSPGDATMLLEIHVRRSGVRDIHRVKLEIIPDRESDEQAHLFGTTNLDNTELAIWCWMFRDTEKKKLFLLRFMEIEEEKEPVQPVSNRPALPPSIGLIKR